MQKSSCHELVLEFFWDLREGSIYRISDLCNMRFETNSLSQSESLHKLRPKERSEMPTLISAGAEYKVRQPRPRQYPIKIVRRVKLNFCQLHLVRNY